MGDEFDSPETVLLKELSKLSTEDLIKKMRNWQNIVDCDFAALVLRNRASIAPEDVPLLAEEFEKLARNKNAFFRGRCYAIQGLARLAGNHPELIERV